MIHLLILALAMGVFAHDALIQGDPSLPQLSTGPLLAVVLGIKIVLGLAYHGLAVRALRQLGRSNPNRVLQKLERITQLFRLLILGLYGLDLSLGWCIWVRSTLISTVLLDELIVMLPTLVLLTWSWWAYYPIERRVRAASQINHAQFELPTYPIWTRWQYVLAQWRHQVALILLPLLVVMAWAEAVERWPIGDWLAMPFDPKPLLLVAGTWTIFLLAPLGIRRLWDTVPLPAGDLRYRLEAMCRTHRVRVRQLLLWRTYGCMINAAVLGLLPRVRYILLTDALLDQMPQRQVEAVMAHELAHVRKRYMFWLLAAAVVSLGLLEVAVGAGLAGLEHVLPQPSQAADNSVTDLLTSSWVVLSVAAILVGGSWIVIFGWISRRIERQADTFAVQHMAHEEEHTQRDETGCVIVSFQAAQTMIDALQRVAMLNHIPPQRGSWRHGSIAWRQQYLCSLVGQPINALSIDRQMRWIRWAILAGVGVLILTHTVWPAPVMLI